MHASHQSYMCTCYICAHTPIFMYTHICMHVLYPLFVYSHTITYLLMIHTPVKP